MTFTEAIQSGFQHYTKFDGRATRSAYWYWLLFEVAVSIVGNVINPKLGLLVALALFLPSLSVSIRRLHDTNRSGWWILIAIVPIVGIIALIIFYVQDSDAGANDYGEPMAAPAPAPA